MVHMCSAHGRVTYFDKSEWIKRKRLLLGSLLFFAVGPLAVLSGYGAWVLLFRCGVGVLSPGQHMDTRIGRNDPLARSYSSSCIPHTPCCDQVIIRHTAAKNKNPARYPDKTAAGRRKKQQRPRSKPFRLSISDCQSTYATMCRTHVDHRTRTAHPASLAAIDPSEL